MKLLWALILACAFSCYVIFLALASPAKAATAEVDTAWGYIKTMIEETELEKYNDSGFFSNSRERFSANEAKIMCSLAAKHMYQLERERSQGENITMRDAFISILGAYSTCTMAVGWIPDFEGGPKL